MYCHRVGRQSICCESLLMAKNELDIPPPTKKSEEKLDPEAFNPLKYTPEEAIRAVDEIGIQKELESAIVKQPTSTLPPSTTTEEELSTRATTKKITKHRNYIDNENTRRITLPQYISREKLIELDDENISTPPSTSLTRRPNIKDNHVRTNVDQARAFGAQTKAEKANDKETIDNSVEYKPHNSGGYAFSRKLEKINSRAQNPQQKALAQQFLVDQIREGWPYNEKFYRPESKHI